MRAFLTAYARAVGAVGVALLAAALLLDSRWRDQPVALVVLTAAVLFMRLQQIPLTKYGALNLLSMPAVAGALVAGAPASALALWIGVLVGDAMFLKKGLEIAWINAGREVVAIIAAYGIFAWARSRPAPS